MVPQAKAWQHPQIKAVTQLTGCIDIEFFMKKMTSRMDCVSHTNESLYESYTLEKLN